MTQLRIRGLRLPIVGALFGVGILGVLRSRRRRRPNGTQLMAMDDAAFAKFIESTGLQTVTSAGLGSSQASTD